MTLGPGTLSTCPLARPPKTGFRISPRGPPRGQTQRAGRNRFGSVRKTIFPGSTRFGLRFSDASWLGSVRFGSVRPVRFLISSCTVRALCRKVTSAPSRMGMSALYKKGEVKWGTPSSHTKISATKICSKGWVAQKPFVDR